jgi:hypothetical protein
MVVHIVLVREYNYLIVRLILHVPDQIHGQIGLHIVGVVLRVVMVPVRVIEIVQAHHRIHLVLLLVMGQVLL